MIPVLGFPSYQKGEPLHDLLMEIKRDLKKQMKQMLQAHGLIINLQRACLIQLNCR